MNVPIDKLLEEIGRLHVTNAVLTEELAKARHVLRQQADQLEAHSTGEPPDEVSP